MLTNLELYNIDLKIPPWSAPQSDVINYNEIYILFFIKIE